MMGNIEYGRERLKDIVDKETREEEQGSYRTRKTPHRRQHRFNYNREQRALKGDYRRFTIPGIPKVDIDNYVSQTKLHIKMLIEDKIKETQYTKVIITSS